MYLHPPDSRLPRAGLARVHQIHDRAVVAEGSAAAKIGNGGEDVFHGQTLRSAE
jgi:hypothetical protein